MGPDGAPSSTPDTTVPQSMDPDGDPSSTVEADSLAAFVAHAHRIQNGPAAPRPACGARDDTLPKRASIPFTRCDSPVLSECETPVASRASELPAAQAPITPTQMPSAARKVRSVVRLEDILDELHVAVRLRDAPLPRRQKLQSSWD